MVLFVVWRWEGWNAGYCEVGGKRSGKEEESEGEAKEEGVRFK